MRRSLPHDPPRLVDLGMGRGRDLIYFARRGFRVLGIDSDLAALGKAERRAARMGARIRTKQADLRTVRLTGTYDVVFSSAALNALPEALRARRIADFQRATSVGGIHAVNAFVPQPRPLPPPELEPGFTDFGRGELRSYYRDWEVLEAKALTFDCRLRGASHQHRVETVVARRP